MIRFRFNADKAYQAILWILTQECPLDLHTVLKACYFADKSHLNEFGRPIFGATYRAMKYGPVPLEIYEMLKGEPMWLCETGKDEFPWRLRGRGRIEIEPLRIPVPPAYLPREDEDKNPPRGARPALSPEARVAAIHGTRFREAALKSEAGGSHYLLPLEDAGLLPRLDLRVFSQTDLEHLKAGFARARSMTFDARTRETHGRDWQRANLGMMDYADMIEDGPDRDEKIEDLQSVALRMVI